MSSKEAVRNGLKKFGIPIRESHKPHRRPSQPKFGEKIQKGKTEPHMAERRVIRAVLEMHNDKLSLRQIARYLDEMKVSTKCRGKKWHPQMVKRIIQNNLQVTVEQPASKVSKKKKKSIG